MDHSKADFQSKLLDQLEGRARELTASAAEARVVLQQAQAEYDYIVGELSELNGQISSLRASQSTQRTNMPARVMRAFPDELLDMIFVEVVQDLRSVCWDSWESDDPDHGACMDLRRAPMSLANVCCRWRRAALRTSCLWSTVAFSLRSFADAPRFASYVSLFLKRSGTSAVDIAMDWKALDWAAAGTRGGIAKLLQPLEAAAPRWRRFCMLMPPKLVAEGSDVFNIFRHATPLLEVFIISTSYDMRNSFLDALPHYLPHCPRLTTLRVMHCHVIPYRQLAFTPALESLTLACFLPYATVCQLLSLVPNLARLHLALQAEPTEDDADAVREFTLQLPLLRHFTCSQYTDYFLGHLTGPGRIRMPVLDALELINTEAAKINEFLPQFDDLPLRSLVIRQEAAELSQDHADAISVLKSVRHLTIDAFLMGEFFSELHAIDGLPLLQMLTIKPREPCSGCDFENPDDPLSEELLDFVRARTGPEITTPADGDAPSRPCRLERVHFTDLTHVPSWLISQLRLLTTLG